MDKNLQIAIDALYSSLTVNWSDNGNIMANAVRDSVTVDLSILTGLEFSEVLKKVETLVSDSQ